MNFHHFYIHSNIFQLTFLRFIHKNMHSTHITIPKKHNLLGKPIYNKDIRSTSY